MFCFQCDSEVDEEEYNKKVGVCIYCKELNDKWDKETYKEEN